MEIIEAFVTKNPCYQANVNKADSRYTLFQSRGPTGLMLHSVGCAQPKAEVFARGWNREDYDRACAHAVVDARTGAVWQTLPWNYRGWHCGGSGNDSHLGVELCESAAIRYESGARFTVLDREQALADCARTYRAAVELFAFLCVRYALDPARAICSHREGGKAGIASGHADPEHYWSGLGCGYTMDGFRSAVAAEMARTAPEPQNPPAPQAPSPAGPGPQAPAAPAPAENAPDALPFPDVPADAWYAEALRWAVENRVVLPSAGPFYPDKPLTKASAVVLLRRLWNALQ